MDKLTPQDIQQANQITGFNVPTNGSPAVPSRADQVMQIAQKAQTAPAVANSTNTPSSISDVLGGVKSLSDQTVQNTKNTQQSSFNNMQSDVTNGANDINQGNQAIKGGDVGGAVKNYGKAAIQGGLGTTSDLINFMLAPLSGAIKTGIDTNAGAISDNKTVQNIATGGVGDALQTATDKINQLATTHPTVFKGIMDAINVGMTAVGGAKTPEALDTLGQGIKSDANAVAGGVKSAVEKATPVVQNAADAVSAAGDKVGASIDKIPVAVKDAGQNALVNSEKKAWSAPATQSKSMYKNAVGIFNKAASEGHDIPDTAVKYGIRLADNIDGKNYDTANTAQGLREDLGKANNQLLRKSFKMADSSVPLTPTKDVIDNAIKNIKGDKFTVGENKDALQSKILTEVAPALERQYPNGMKLSELNDEKVLRGMNTKRSPIGDPATNLEAKKNEVLRDTLAKMVEDKAPEDIPVHDVQQTFRKGYLLADYLDELHGKKVPTTVLSKLSNLAGKGLGVLAAGKLGGGILADMVGYHTGGVIEDALANAPARLRAVLMENLKDENTDAYEKMSAFFKNMETRNNTQPRLPAPEPLGTSKNPIITPAPTTYEPAAKQINRNL